MMKGPEYEIVKQLLSSADSLDKDKGEAITIYTV